MITCRFLWSPSLVLVESLLVSKLLRIDSILKCCLIDNFCDPTERTSDTNSIILICLQIQFHPSCSSENVGGISINQICFATSSSSSQLLPTPKTGWHDRSGCWWPSFATLRNYTFYTQFLRKQMWREMCPSNRTRPLHKASVPSRSPPRTSAGETTIFNSNIRVTMRT